MLTLPIANPIGPTSGPLGDGVIYGVLPRRAPTTALSMVHLVPFTSVYRGNSDASGSVTYSDITVAANSDAVGDVALFDAANPTADRLCISVDAGDLIDGIALLISTAAGLTGTPAAQVKYKRASDGVWLAATGVVTPSLTATGLVVVTFPQIAASEIGLIDDLIDPIANPQRRCLFLQFSGITGVTTPPAFTRVWKRLVHTGDHRGTDFTSLVAQGDTPDFSSAQAVVLPVTGDLMLFGFDEKPVRLFPTMYRAGLASHQKEWVYSKADGSFVALPAGSINDPTTRLTTPLATQAVASANLTSTYTGATWGNSGVSSVQVLAGDGYIQFKVGSPASAANMIGFSTSDPNTSYTSINWAAHMGHGGTAFASQWVNGVQQSGGTWAIATGDAIRLERKAGVFSIYQNGVLRHIFTQTSTAALLIDTAFISSSNVTELILVGTSLGYGVPIAVTWQNNTAVTVASGPSVSLAVATANQIPLAPPSDWGKATMTDTGGTQHSRYWIGFRTTANASVPILPANFTLRAQPIKGSGVVGIPAPEAATYASLTLAARDPATQATTLLLVNATAGSVAQIDLPMGAYIATATVSLLVAKGDVLLLVQPLGEDGALGDGALFLS